MRRRVGFDDARRVLVDHHAGQPIPNADALVAQAQALCGPGATRLQRPLLALALEQRPEDLAIRQRLARTTYYDPELSAHSRLERALETLEPVLEDAG